MEFEWWSREGGVWSLNGGVGRVEGGVWSVNGEVGRVEGRVWSG